MTYALSSRPRNIVPVVVTASMGVTGSMSRGTIEVTIPAPQKKACEYLVARSGSCLSHLGGCHVFSPAYHGEWGRSCLISRSEMSHQRQPNQWQIIRPMMSSLTTESTPALRNSSNSARYLASLAMRKSFASLARRSSRSMRFMRSADESTAPPSASSRMSPYGLSGVKAIITRLSGKEPMKSMKKEPRR